MSDSALSEPGPGHAARGRVGPWARRWAARAAVVCAGLLVLAAAGLLSQARARAALRLVGGFSPLDQDPRVLYEAGAGDNALAVAKALPEAIGRVQHGHGEPPDPGFRVYVCATQDSFTRKTGQSEGAPVRGIAFSRDIWVSPLAFRFHGRDTHRETLAHELSHLRLQQSLGWWRRTRIVPSWFQEGLADRVADTGFEQVSRAEAWEAIRDGPCLTPDDSGRFPFPKRAGDYGLTWPMFHAQSRMFVEFLHERDGGGIARLLTSLHQGARFGTAFAECFGGSVEEVWAEFVGSVEAEREARGTGLEARGGIACCIIPALVRDSLYGQLGP